MVWNPPSVSNSEDGKAVTLADLPPVFVSCTGGRGQRGLYPVCGGSQEEVAPVCDVVA